jgi:hypothetical protein
VGFSFADNPWCDLLDATTYGGRVNPGRPFAIAAMLTLCVGLATTWWNAPRAFPDARRRGVIVRAAGLGSAVIAPWVAGRAHDLVVEVAFVLGAVGFVTTMTALGRKSGPALSIVAASALTCSLVNYAIWRTGVGLSALALVQKGAFALFLAWMVLFALRFGA